MGKVLFRSSKDLLRAVFPRKFPNRRSLVLRNFSKVKFVALLTIVDGRFMLQVAQRAFTVVRRCMRIRIEFFGFFCNCCLGMTFHAGIFVRVFDVVHILAVTNRAGNTFSNVTVGSESICCKSTARDSQ